MHMLGIVSAHIGTHCFINGEIMNLSKRFLAASIGALPLIMCTQVSAATPLMAAPLAQLSPQENSALVTQLLSKRASYGLDEQHGYQIMAQHPGVSGTRVSR